MSGPTSERRVATIMFADISGFTSMSERLEPEEVTELMDACFETIGSIAERHGGVIDKYIGDCVMLLFGAPTALEGAPEKALLAALEIRDAIEGISQGRQLHEPVSVHIGVNTGTVVAGTVGSSGKKIYTVMGDPVNVASRLKDSASRGQILVGRDTWMEAQRLFVFGEARMVEVKGKERSVEARELLACSAGAGVPGCLDEERLSPLVGRDAEMRALELRLLQAEEGQGSIVILSGEPGIGKSRLVAELLSSKSAKGILRLEGRCYSLGRNLPYHPFVDMLKRWAGIVEANDEDIALRKLEKAIGEIAVGGAEFMFPFVARLLGLAPKGVAAARLEGIQGEALEALIGERARDLFSRLSDSKPLLVVVEDLHWADESSLELLESLLHFSESKRICFLLSMRPDYEDTGERIRNAAREHHTGKLKELPLASLGKADSEKLLDGILETGGFPPALRDRIVERSDGNPYFIEEVLRSLVDEGAIIRGSSGWKAATGLEGRQIPSTIQEVLIGRIDRLDEKTRNLVRIASVIGRSFSYRVLADVAASIDELEGKIVHLTEIQLILKAERCDELEYLFEHALAQEVAYESLLVNKRRELHRAVAGAIERLFPDRLGEFAGMLAWHCVRAEDFDRAEEYMVKAGEEAVKSAASSEALAYYREAFELYLKKRGSATDPAKVARFEVNIARALFCKGNFEEALPHYDKALDHLGGTVPGSGLPPSLSVLLGVVSLLAWLYLPEGNRKQPLPDTIREYLGIRFEKLQMLTHINSQEMVKECLHLLRVVFLFKSGSKFDTALEVIGAMPTVFAYGGISLSLSQRCIDRLAPLLNENTPHAILTWLVGRTIHDLCAGIWDRPGSFDHPVVIKEIEKGFVNHIINLLYNECLFFLERGDWSSFGKSAGLLSTIGERFNNQDAAFLWSALLIMRSIKLRNLEEASGRIPWVLQMLAASGLAKEGVPNILTCSSRVAILAGDLERAEAELEHANELSPGPKGSPSREGLFRGAAAAIAVEKMRRTASTGRVGGQLCREGRRATRAFLAKTGLYAPDRTEALKLMGSCEWLAGRKGAALSWWRRSIAEGERLGAKIELAHTLHDAGELLGAMKPGPDWRARAVALYSELGIGIPNGGSP
jgi:class 3 adenylate cyclase/tetratricopeptide (TPR) repeat protein